MSNSNNENYPNCLEAFTSVLDRMGYDFKFSDSIIIQPTIDKLGNSEDAMKARLLLLRIMEKGWMSPQQLLDRLRPALVDENAKLVEEALILLTATVEKFDPDKTISADLLAEVVKVISSTSGSVQEAAKKLFKTILSPVVQVDHQEVTTRASESKSESKSKSASQSKSASESEIKEKEELKLRVLATSSEVDHSVVEADKVDIEEIIENCINLEWKERKKNLKEMEKILIEGHILTQTQLEKLKSNLSKLFGERHKDVFTSFLDVIKALVAAYHEDLDDWIDTVCTWLFSQFCKENVKSIEERIKGVLDVIRECFPVDQLLLVAIRCLNDPTLCKTSSIGGRVIGLKFIQQIIETVDPCLSVETVKAALVPLVPLLEDDSLEVKRHAQSCVVSLYNLNPQEMTGPSPVSSTSIVPASTNQAAKPPAPSKVSSSSNVPASTNQAAKPPAPSPVSSTSIVPASTNQAAKPPAPSPVSSTSIVPESTNQAAKTSALSEVSSSSNVPAPIIRQAEPLVRYEGSSMSNVPTPIIRQAEPLVRYEGSSMSNVPTPIIRQAEPLVRYEVPPSSNVPVYTTRATEPFSSFEGSSISNVPASTLPSSIRSLIFTTCQVPQSFDFSAPSFRDTQWAPSRTATRSNVRCGCTRCQCNTNHCTCRKNGYRCGSNCGCVNCRN